MTNLLWEVVPIIFGCFYDNDQIWPSCLRTWSPIRLVLWMTLTLTKLLKWKWLPTLWMLWMTMIRHEQPVHGRGLQGQQSSSGKTSGECVAGCNHYEHHSFMKLAMDCKTYWLYWKRRNKCLKGTDKLTDYMLSPSLALLAVEWKKISFQNMRSFQGWYFSICSKYWYDLYWRDQICEQGRESEIINEKEAALESESGLMKHEPVLERRGLWVRRPRKGRWWCSETRRSWSGQIWRERRWSPRQRWKIIT